MVKDCATRGSFFFAAALIAAALGDPIVESISNTGILGGHYCDHNHLSVLPALFAGSVFLLAILLRRCLSVLTSRTASRDWLVDLATTCSDRPSVRSLASSFGMQLGALWFMESAEQLALGGHLLGGTAWLGGPIAFSLIVHALIGAGCLLALGAFMRALVRTFAAIVSTFVRSIWVALVRPPASTRFGYNEERCPASGTVRVHQIGGRAPPLLFTPA